MSGGSYDYLFRSMEDAADTLKRSPIAYRRAFSQLMFKCAEAMHDIEWVDSGDTSPGDDEEAIMKCINHVDVLKTVVKDAQNITKELEELIQLVTDQVSASLAACDKKENEK